MKKSLTLLAFTSVLALPTVVFAGTADDRYHGNYREPGQYMRYNQRMEYDRGKGAFKIYHNAPGQEHKTNYGRLLGYEYTAKRFQTHDGRVIELKGESIKLVQENNNAFYAPDGPYTLQNGLTFYAKDGAIMRIDAPTQIVYIDSSLVDPAYWGQNPNPASSQQQGRM